jgi:hypothetical protein
MAKDTVIIVTIAAILLAVAGGHASGKGGKHHPWAYNQGFKTGTNMRERVNLPLQKGNVALLRYCRQAPYTADISPKHPLQWLAGYDAGCDGE